MGVLRLFAWFEKTLIEYRKEELTKAVQGKPQ